MGKLKRSENKKAHFIRYRAQDTCRKNRIKALERHVKANPSDNAAYKALSALENGEVAVKRCKPKGRPTGQEPTGMQVIGEREIERNGRKITVPIYSYKTKELKPGHPALRMLDRKNKGTWMPGYAQLGRELFIKSSVVLNF